MIYEIQGGGDDSDRDRHHSATRGMEMGDKGVKASGCCLVFCFHLAWHTMQVFSVLRTSAIMPGQYQASWSCVTILFIPECATLWVAERWQWRMSVQIAIPSTSEG